MNGRATDGRAAARARSLLVSLQIAGAFALLAGCGLMVRTIRHLVDVPTGMTVERLVEATLATREQRYPSLAERAASQERLLAELEQAPGVSAAALISPSSLAMYQPRRITTDGDPARTARSPIRYVTPGWFTMLGVAVVDGRGFTARDRYGSEPVAIVSESLARSLWPGSRAVGRRLRQYDPGAARGDSTLVVRTVVGVVRDVRQTPTDSLLADAYVPALQSPQRFLAILITPTGAPSDWTSALRRIVRSVDPEAAVSTAQSLSSAVREQTRRPRFLASLFGVFGVVAFGIGVLGVYGVTAYSARQREREIAVRIAVGADRGRVLRMFLRQSGAQLAVGLGLGLVAAIGVGRLLAAELFGVASAELVTFALVAGLVAAASSVAVAWPAWRAAGMDPNPRLRSD